MTPRDYKILAKALGMAFEYIRSNSLGTTAFMIVVDSIVAELQIDNPRFDEDQFRKAITTSFLKEGQ